MELDSLLGGFVADLTRLCDIMFPEGETVTLGFDCEAVCFTPSFELVDSVGEAGFPSVGVGGVTNVVGASMRFGGVAGICVTMRLGATDRRDVLDCVCSRGENCGGEACKGCSSTFVSRFFPPNKAPNPPPLVLGLAGSASAPTVFGDVDLRVGANASLSLPTGDGDTPRLFAAMSIVLACWSDTSSAEAAEPTRVASVESIVSDVIRGDDSVKRPAWDWCGEMPGLFSGGLMFG